VQGTRDKNKNSGLEVSFLDLPHGASIQEGMAAMSRRTAASPDSSESSCTLERAAGGGGQNEFRNRFVEAIERTSRDMNLMVMPDFRHA
jgi:hypothetical protein